MKFDCATTDCPNTIDETEFSQAVKNGMTGQYCLICEKARLEERIGRLF